jgi:hypothetical protein
MRGLRELEMHKGIGPGLNAALSIVDIDFDVQRAGGVINRIRVADDRALERLAGELIQGQRGFGSGLRSLGIDLGTAT